MRTLFAASTVLMAVTALATPVEAQSQKIGFLDSSRILAEAPGAAEARTAIQQEMARYDARMQAMSDSIAKMVSDYEKQSVLLSPDEKKKREDAIRQRQAAAQQRVEFMREEAASKQQELMEPVMTKVDGVIEAIRKEGGYAIIFDTQSRAIVSADSTLDITNTVIARLKAQASASNGSGRN